jgi:hypothetical protein
MLSLQCTSLLYPNIEIALLNRSYLEEFSHHADKITKLIRLPSRVVWEERGIDFLQNACEDATIAQLRQGGAGRASARLERVQPVEKGFFHRDGVAFCGNL